jgi:hypothetical protein
VAAFASALIPEQALLVLFAQMILLGLSIIHSVRQFVSYL